MNRNCSEKVNKFELDYPARALRILSFLKEDQDSLRHSYSLFIGKNNLFSNLTIEENFLHQSKLENMEEINQFTKSPAQKRYLDETIINFKNFYPDQVPNEIIISASLLSALVKDTDIVLYTWFNVISEDDINIAKTIIEALNEKTKFFDIDQKINALQSPAESNENSIKAA